MSADSVPEAQLRAELAAAAKLLRTDPRAALRAAVGLVKRAPDMVDAMLLSAAALRQLKDAKRATEAEREAVRAAMRSPDVQAIRRALDGGDHGEVERLARVRLGTAQTDVVTLQLLAAALVKSRRIGEAEPVLRQAIGFAPSFTPARQDLAQVLSRLGKREEEIDELRRLLMITPGDIQIYRLATSALTKVGRHDEAIDLFETMIGRFPPSSETYLYYGHALRGVGRTEDSIAAYRRALEVDPAFGSAWWALANLKTFRFTADDVARMRATSQSLEGSERAALEFALGKALEDGGEFSQSFAHYAEANRLRRGVIDYEADGLSAFARGSEELFTPNFFTARSGFGAQDPAPIFVVGLQRSGSTLVEQILASHAMIEGLAELPDIPAITRRMGARQLGSANEDYLRSVREMDDVGAVFLGDEYLRMSKVHRATDRPRFIDKLPNNWLHIGLIHLILPNAKIVDVRRNPLDCCLSNFRQNYSDSLAFAYDLSDLGRYYRDYVELMDHFDTVLPGRVHRIIYEDLIEDTEVEVRRLLDYLDLPFDPRCLRFFENDRTVRTPSSEQVRRPLNREGMDRWRAFEPWLGPLKEALGPALDHYRGIDSSRPARATRDSSHK